MANYRPAAATGVTMRVEQVDPFKVNVDDMNERRDNVTTSELEASVAEQGVIEPPIVRVRDESADVPYSVIVGQRRTLAAQSVGLDTIPVVVRDLDDGDALLSSITENVDAFRESVSKKDRALAIARLKDMNGWNNGDVADSLGVSSATIDKWLEYTHPEWEGTSVDPNVSEEKENNDIDELSKKVDKLNEEYPATVRRMAGDNDDPEELLEKAVIENDLNRNEIQEAKKRTQAGQDPTVAIEKVAEKKGQQQSTTQKVKIETTLTNDTAVAAKSFAQGHGMTTNEMAEQAIEQFLSDKGEL